MTSRDDIAATLKEMRTVKEANGELNVQQNDL